MSQALFRRRAVAAVATFSLVAGGAALLASPSSAAPGARLAAGAAADTAFGLVSPLAPDDNRITVFSVNTPADQSDTRVVSGVLAGEELVGFDVRPQTGVLYAVGYTSDGTAGSLYRLTSTTGSTVDEPIGTTADSAITATRVGALPILDGTEFGVDFNPMVDRLRIVSDTGQNLRINPDTAAGATPGGDGDLTYASGDVNETATPTVGAAGYTNSSSATPTSTMLYDIDSSQDVLVEQNPANAGTLETVGPLGIGDVAQPMGLDISAADNTAFAVLETEAVAASTGTVAMDAVDPALYRIDLATGAAEFVDDLGNPDAGSEVEDIALASTTPAPDPSASPSPSASATASASPSPSASATSSASASPSPSASGTVSPSPSASNTATAGRFHPLTPARIFDSREAPNTRIQAGADRRVQVTGRGGIPTSGVSAVVLNVTETLGSVRGDLQVYPTGQRPANRTSNLNYFQGEAVPVQVQLGVGTAGGVTFSVNTGSADVIVDVFGWYGDNTDNGGDGYTALQPQRLLDTRTSGQSPVRAGTDQNVQVSGRNGVPANATAVAFNATLLGTPANADLQVYPTGNRPGQRTSNLNVRRGQTKANAVVTDLGSNGQISLSISQNQASVVLDVLGYYSPGSAGRFVPLQPQRIFDTRTSDRPAVTSDRTARIRGEGGVPANATAAVLSVTATGAGQSLDLQVFPTGNRPTNRTSTLNLRPAEAVANLAPATIGTDGTVSLSVSRNQAQVILDVVGYFTNG